MAQQVNVALRNQRLQALLAATQAWAQASTQQLTDQVTTLQSILVGRTGSDSLPQAAVDATSLLVVSSINDFLTGA